MDPQTFNPMFMQYAAYAGYQSPQLAAAMPNMNDLEQSVASHVAPSLFTSLMTPESSPALSMASMPGLTQTTLQKTSRLSHNIGGLTFIDQTITPKEKPAKLNTPNSTDIESGSEQEASASSGKAKKSCGKKRSGPAKKYYCQYENCGKSFTTSGHLSRHTRIHLGERPFTCSWPGCNKSFSRQDNMRQHVKTHTKDKSPSPPRPRTTTFTPRFINQTSKYLPSAAQKMSALINSAPRAAANVNNGSPTLPSVTASPQLTALSSAISSLGIGSNNYLSQSMANAAAFNNAMAAAYMNEYLMNNSLFGGFNPEFQQQVANSTSPGGLSTTSEDVPSPHLHIHSLIPTVANPGSPAISPLSTSEHEQQEQDNLEQQRQNQEYLSVLPSIMSSPSVSPASILSSPQLSSPDSIVAAQVAAAAAAAHAAAMNNVDMFTKFDANEMMKSDPLGMSLQQAQNMKETGMWGWH